MRDLEDVEVNFDGITYAKGASVLKQLVSWVGQDEFFAGVRAYFAKHAWGNTELRDLLTELEATSGRDLSAWSGLWLEKAGVTLLRPEIDGRRRRRHHLVRRPAGGARRAPGAAPAPPRDRRLRPRRRRPAGSSAPSHVELDVDGPRTEVPAAGRRAAPRARAGQRRRPRLRQGPPRRAVAGRRRSSTSASSTTRCPARSCGPPPGTPPATARRPPATSSTWC